MNSKATWIRMWDLRHEPLSVMLGLAVLLLTLTAIALVTYQVFVLGEPLRTDGGWLPRKSSEPPIGTVVAFFGMAEDIPDGWALCDGATIPEGSKLARDANHEVGGNQLPDLRGRFIRGSDKVEVPGPLNTGGRDTYTETHSHLWIDFHDVPGKNVKGWHTYTKEGGVARVDNWEGGVDNAGDGYFPLEVSGHRDFKGFTDTHEAEQDNRPEFTELMYIIRIK